MNFLNTNNALLLEKLSDQELSSQWMQWMLQASLHYQAGEFQQAAKISGSATELSLILFQSHESSTKKEACKFYSLSVIYFLNILRHQDMHSKAQKRSQYFTELLQQCIQNCEEQENIKKGFCEHVHLLNNTLEHEAYFESHLNLHIPNCTFSVKDSYQSLHTPEDYR